jgi:NCS1 family nucleobase:cation symporter-1
MDHDETPSSETSAGTSEYERERVPESALLGSGKFWGMYAGEHAAGTEFMIGPLFLAAGASLQDLLLGLLLGNFLAVLTWRFLVTPIAMAKRMTLYYQLERIAGGSLVKFYNVVNGLLFCFLAGAMVTVSASAVGVPFNITFDVPDAMFGLSNPSFTGLVAIVGIVIAAVAAGGYQRVAGFANIAAPWMIGIFAACGIVSLAQMDATNMPALSEGKFWSDAIAFVQEKNGPQSFGFWQIVVFAWLCNGAMHFGMADLSIFRFARSKASGWAPAIGMFLGHYMAWIAAALLLAALIKISPETAVGGDGKVSANPGLLAYQSLGWAGIICVVIAGWTTANPTIYRAGLAFQGVLPKSSRTAMTLLAGAVATIAGAFPNLSAQLLNFVGTYGTVLGPMGAVIFVDFYLMKKFGLQDEYANRSGTRVNSAVMIAWLLPVAVGLYLIMWQGVFAAYAVIPCWVACGVIYLVLSKMMQKPSSPSGSVTDQGV